MKENKNNIKKDLELNVKDVTHALTKGGLGGIPYIGAEAAEIFNLILAQPISKRRDKWLIYIYKGLKNLEVKVEGFSIKSLSENDNFISAMINAANIAIKNHNKEKLEVLKNAVLNTAIGNSPDDDIQLMFLNLIDTFTSWHIKLLNYFDRPEEFLDKRNIPHRNWANTAIKMGIINAYPELRNDEDFYRQIVKDLSNKSLIDIIENIDISISRSEVVKSQTTKLGKRFIAFIKTPFEE